MAVREKSEIIREELWRFTKDQYYRLSEMGWFLETKVELIEGIIIEKYPDTPAGEPRSMPWTVTQYHQIADMGWLDETRTELINGDIIEMPPIGTRHMTAVMLATQALEAAFEDSHVISVQNAFRVGVRMEPQPDLAVLPGSIRDYTDRMPTDAVLIVEVSDMTLAYDRSWKKSLYAQAYIQEYWIINLDQQQVEVYRSPELKPDDAPAFSYKESRICRVGDFVSPLAAAHFSIPVSDLLP